LYALEKQSMVFVATLISEVFFIENKSGLNYLIKVCIKSNQHNSPLQDSFHK